uniref:WAP domain-containing protein n=1 Tax=Ceratitis capitata TaxID=7213 RepID=W8C475_CERCA
MFRHNGSQAFNTNNNNYGGATFKVILLLLLALVVMSNAQSCPSASRVLTCTPKCKQDSDCSAIGGKCCPNLCNERSCIQRNQLDLGGGDKSGGDKYSSSNSGSYCGNTKCSPYEKCEMDRSTKRQKCVRT